jgi:hypothetical protein
MNVQTRKADDELIAAHRHLTEAYAALQSIGQRSGFGAECACGNGGACAYHASLINRLFDVMRAVADVSDKLRADIADPGRDR